MPPIIHLVRPAEGLHNLGQAYWSLIDPPLTDKGRGQCLQLRNNFPFHSNVELVVSFPMCRAIHSALEGFLPVLQSRQGQKLILPPDLQEIGNFPCDIRCDVENLKERLEGLDVLIDYSHVDDSWTSKDGRYKPTIEAIRERAHAVRSWLDNREEKEIVVVSHAIGWTNVEYRTYELQIKCKSNLDAPSSCIGNISMIETVESRQRRGKTGPVRTWEEQGELHIKALEVWEEQGYLLGANDRDRFNGGRNL